MIKLSDENNSDKIPVEVISEDKMETKNSLEESKNTDNIEKTKKDSNLIIVKANPICETLQ